MPDKPILKLSPNPDKPIRSTIKLSPETQIRLAELKKHFVLLGCPTHQATNSLIVSESLRMVHKWLLKDPESMPAHVHFKPERKE